jgi:hypothetical protein
VLGWTRRTWSYVSKGVQPGSGFVSASMAEVYLVLESFTVDPVPDEIHRRLPCWQFGRDILAAGIIVKGETEQFRGS